MHLFIELPSHIFSGSAVYCKPLGQQKKRKDSFLQAPGFCADGIFTFVVHFGVDSSYYTHHINHNLIHWLVVVDK